MSWVLMQQKAKEQVDDCIKISKIVHRCYPKTFDMWNSPIHKSVSLLYWTHESGIEKRDGVFVPKPWVMTNYPEIGGMALTAQSGRDDEVSRMNVYPFHPYSCVYAAQKSFEENIKLVSKYLINAGFNSFENLFVGDQISLILLPRAIGCGTTRVLLKKSFEDRFKKRPIIAIVKFLEKESTNTDSYDGQQNTDVVRLRVLWCCTMPLRAHELGLGEPLDTKRLESAKNRNSEVQAKPVDLYDRIDFYYEKEKKAGCQCETI